MSLFEERKKFLANAGNLLEEAKDRIASNTDPLTGEEWEGDTKLFYAQHKTLMDMIKKGGDVLPDAGDSKKVKTNLERMQVVVNMVFDGKISPADAMEYLEPIMLLIEADELKEAQELLQALEAEQK